MSYDKEIYLKIVQYALPINHTSPWVISHYMVCPLFELWPLLALVCSPTLRSLHILFVISHVGTGLPWLNQY